MADASSEYHFKRYIGGDPSMVIAGVNPADGVADVDRKITVRQMDEGLLGNLNPALAACLVCFVRFIGVASLNPGQRSLLRGEIRFLCEPRRQMYSCPIG
ncbi:hypothetical protein [Candidatus Amarobacter glycogenicus]|uniref:hypothetical protein n=1 Tax=Candidatus Amarobacter glycogenicus TaxID=3140699 RepID=UPI002A129EAF|nr:hypothetical protein [Dehalococcoidia bacterium]